jgi:hypothetical protein
MALIKVHRKQKTSCQNYDSVDVLANTVVVYVSLYTGMLNSTEREKDKNHGYDT